MQAQDHFLNNLNYFHNLVIKVSRRVLRAHSFSTCERGKKRVGKYFLKYCFFCLLQKCWDENT